MPDMLVKLYDLPDAKPVCDAVKQAGFDIRRALAPEKHLVSGWVKENFSAHWASECEASFAGRPISCYLAVKDGRIAGFACYDATCKAFFGPTGVHPDWRGQGVGKALLLASLQAMYAEGYAYAIIGGAGPQEFYARTAGATVIEGSSPGIYRGMLR
jgi:GNAT superfamily N-acetyltransferase